jgi:hypothetical protein
MSFYPFRNFFNVAGLLCQNYSILDAGTSDGDGLRWGSFDCKGPAVRRTGSVHEFLDSVPLMVRFVQVILLF